MMASRIIFTLTSVIGILMVAHLGHLVLAASALVSSSYTFISLAGMGILFSMSPVISRANGKKEFAQIGKTVQQGMLLGLLISVPCMFVLWHIDSILLFFNQSRALCQLVQAYFHWAIWGLPPLMLVVCFSQFLSGVFKQVTGLWLSVFGFVTMTLFNYVFIFGKLGAPAMGIAGMGVAFALNYWFLAIFSFIFFGRHSNYARFKLFQVRLNKNFEPLKLLFKIGWPISMQVSTELFAVFTRVLFVGWLGTMALAASQIVSQYIFLFVVPIFAIAQSAGILIGNAMGAKNYHEIKQYGHWSMLVSIIYSVIVLTLFLIFGHYLVSIFLPHATLETAHIAHLALLVLYIVLGGQFFDALRNVMTGGLRGLFDTRAPMVISILGLWVIGIPLGYVLAFPMHWGYPGLAIATNVGIVISTILVWRRWVAKTKMQV